ncbi:hypothetical protein MKX01_002184 [Papaver californicum]|nr:hypothetical protein MKX01_002184 [Papaver californicum]
MSRLKVSSSLKFIPNVVKETSSLMIPKLVEANSVVPHEIRLFVKVIIAYGLFRVVLEVIHKLLTWEWDFLNVNDLIRTEVDGTEIFGFVERKRWFGGVTIEMKNRDRFFISNGKQMRFTTELKVEMHEVERIREKINKIFKDLEHEDSSVVVYDTNFTTRRSVLLVSCFTKTDTHEDYFTIRDALLVQLPKLIHTTS